MQESTFQVRSENRRLFLPTLEHRLHPTPVILRDSRQGNKDQIILAYPASRFFENKQALYARFIPEALIDSRPDVVHRLPPLVSKLVTYHSEPPKFANRHGHN